MKRSTFVRNLRAPELFERFFVSAVSSLLLLRFYLHASGYPQVGGGSLHIAHMLWGGLLMLAALVLVFAFLGIRVQRLAAIIGGAGFGIFIDEIGKFLTRDNDYFFRPAIGIIYAVFVLLYLAFNFLNRRRRKLTAQEYQLNALAQLEEAALNDMDSREKAAVTHLLSRADPDSPLTDGLKKLLAKVQTVGQDSPGPLRRAGAALGRWYRRLWSRRGTDVSVRLFFLAEAGVFLLAVVLALANNFDNVQDFFRGTADYGQSLVIGQLVSTVLASIFAVLGVLRLRRSRALALEYFRRATLTNLLLTEFFIFSRIQFGAMPGFIFNLVLLIVINFCLHEESRQRR